MPLDTLPAPSGLASRAYDQLSGFFTEVGHRPSAPQWTALRDLLDHLERAAAGRLAPAVYLSAIPPGTGKSQAILAFARALMDTEASAGAGLLITCNRIQEVADMAGQLARYRAMVAVITSDTEVNALGAHEAANDAQVCICTQASLKLALRAMGGGPFGDAAKFHYRGRRRAVVCWDEAFAFRRPVTLDGDTVAGLTGALRKQSNAAVIALQRWMLELSEGGNGVRSVPDFAALEVDFRRLVEDAGENDGLAAQVEALKVMSGGQGYASRGDFGPTMITHVPELPPSMMPLIVTDASGSVNPSYRLMARKVPLVRLTEATKAYANLTLRIVPAAASRSVYQDHKAHRGRDLLDMAVRYIRSVPPEEEVLVISYKKRMGMKGVAEGTIREAIDARLTEAEKWLDRAEGVARVHHLTWGQHQSTNDFKTVRRVILMGLYFLPRPVAHAASGAALDLDLIAEHPTATQIAEQRTGMLMDATLQGVLRGHARMGVDGDCGRCEVVIPQTKQTGLSQAQYRAMLPGVRWVDDRILMPDRPLTGRLGELAAIVTRRLAAGEREMTNQSLREEMGMERSNFGTLVRKPEWQAWVTAAGMVPQRLPGRNAGLRLMA